MLRTASNSNENITDSVIQQELLLAIAEGTSRHVGEDFLNSLVETLHSSMDVSMVMIARCGVDKPITRLSTILAMAGDERIDNLEYDIAGTPCEEVYDGECLVVPEGVSKKYTTFKDFEGYAGVPLYDASGRVIGHLGVLSDVPMGNPEIVENVIRIYGQRAEAELQRIDADKQRENLLEELKQVNQRLTHSYELARESNEFKTQVLGMVAHDLRNPLSVVSARSELIEILVDRDNDEKNRKMIVENSSEIFTAARRMEQQIERIIDNARDETRAINLSVAPFDVAAVISQAIDFNLPAADKKEISITYEGPESVTAEADGELLLEAVDNLVSNAVKYSYPSSAVVVSATHDDSEFSISVVDQGQGLSEEDMGKAFNRFTRLSAMPTGGEESVGLGLANVRAVVERQGGAVRAESPGKDKGAVFSITLPIKVVTE
ncbi:MAG: HAMP domain-containing histidine kinase [Rhodospirillaceae bacterium]|jgi:signal transduction histidine kinase|nr:HAMP domain-containing histidine kinase [Rhodospirillaceae bacterium]